MLCRSAIGGLFWRRERFVRYEVLPHDRWQDGAYGVGRLWRCAAALSEGEGAEEPGGDGVFLASSDDGQGRTCFVHVHRARGDHWLEAHDARARQDSQLGPADGRVGDNDAPADGRAESAALCARGRCVQVCREGDEPVRVKRGVYGLAGVRRHNSGKEGCVEAAGDCYGGVPGCGRRR